MTRDQQIERMQACSKIWRKEKFATILASPGGGRVNQSQFDSLSRSEQKQMAELAACLRSSGAVQPMSIEFYAAGKTLRRISTENNIDFASQL